MTLDAVYGVPIAGTDVVEVPGDLAELFAVAHRRVTGRPAGAHDGDGTVRTRRDPPSAGAPLDEVVAALCGAERPVVLAGPGVVRDGAVDGLRALAAAGSLGVLNTWGAKGVFEWTSPHHLATAGLQARDFELGGLADADLIVATGVDDDEARARWRLAPVVEVAPGDLSALAARWSRPAREIPVPRLRTELARVTQAGWASRSVPLPPSRVTRTYSEALAPDGLVAADPGTAGYWVARTFPTSAIGGAVVPGSSGRPGLAVACAVVARMLDPSRPALVALDAAEPTVGVDAVTARVLEAGDQLDVAVGVEIWSADGEPLDADAHAARLQDLLAAGGIVTLATDPTQLDEMVEVAGSVVAWGGIGAPDVLGGPTVGESG